MCNISQLTILVHERAALPDGLELVTEEFVAGWRIAPTINVQQLEGNICEREWSFVKNAERVLASGVGDTSQEAIASALRLALLRMNAQFNAVEVEYIELLRYPLSFLARVRICQYCIQPDAFLAVSDDFMASSISPRKRRLPLDADVLYPDFGSGMPLIKQMLASRKMAQTSPQ
jgi:hypothetical protein